MNAEQKKGIKRPLIVAIVILLVLVVGWHLILPLFGIVVGITAAAWAIAVATIVGLSVVGMLFFALPFFGIMILSVLAFLWVVVAIAFAPILFPLLIPLLIILLFIAFIRRRKNKSEL